LLVGPPGVAKSMLLDALISWLGGSTFSALLSKFSTPEELFGPVSVVGLKADKYTRITTGRLPEADGAFLDEVFKSSSAILNTLLRLLNERTYDNGDGRPKPVPLKLCVGASNEWPQAESGGRELAAVFDRFLFRRAVHPIRSADGQLALYDFAGKRSETVALSTTLAADELKQATAEALALPWSTDAQDAFVAVVQALRQEGIIPGDRRKKKAVKAARAFAWLEGADQVEPQHLEPLASVLWDDPAEQPLKCAEVVARIANPAGLAVNSLLVEAEQVLAATDPRNFEQASVCNKKLDEIQKALGRIKDSPRAATAREYVKDKMTEIRLQHV
jgi:MoxR-like ATPase